MLLMKWVMSQHYQLHCICITLLRIMLTSTISHGMFFTMLRILRLIIVVLFTLITTHIRNHLLGAVGPMQIITRYSHSYAGRKIKESELRNNLRLNIDISCKMLTKLHNMYGRWDLALGYYNTGYPQVNGYAKYASSTYDYKQKWVKPKLQASL